MVLHDDVKGNCRHRGVIGLVGHTTPNNVFILQKRSKNINNTNNVGIPVLKGADIIHRKATPGVDKLSQIAWHHGVLLGALAKRWQALLPNCILKCTYAEITHVIKQAHVM